MGQDMSRVKPESIRILRRQRVQVMESIVNGMIGLPKLHLSGRKKRHKILILSLDAAGKTAMLEYIKFSKVGPTIPTIGNSVITESVAVAHETCSQACIVNNAVQSFEFVPLTRKLAVSICLTLCRLQSRGSRV